MRSRRSEHRLSSTSPPLLIQHDRFPFQRTVEISLHNKDTASLFLKAWKNLHFHYPSVAAYVIDDATSRYPVPESAALKQWAIGTFHIVEDKIADEHIPDIRLGSFTILTYFTKSDEILFYTAHWRTDGIGVLMLMSRRLLKPSQQIPLCRTPTCFLGSTRPLPLHQLSSSQQQSPAYRPTPSKVLPAGAVSNDCVRVRPSHDCSDEEGTCGIR